MDETRTMKVGTVAEAAGLTVRTLHHWDSIGLLSPSERSPAGHRAYTEADLVRLYQVLALRNLGLGLESIAVCLDAGVDPARLVRDHLAEVEAATPSPESARVLARHLDPDQVAELKAHKQAVGPLAHYLLEVEWPELYRRAERHRAAGTAPDDPRGAAPGGPDRRAGDKVLRR
jgi:MerR family transcriptional regulator, thiopeptide resistance regulator